MDITVYLPDELGQEAKAQGINLSATLRKAVTEELERRETMRETLGKVETYEVSVENRDGQMLTGRITGRIIDQDDDWTLYLTEDERVIVHNRSRSDYEEFPAAEAEDHLDPTRFAGAFAALGIKPVVDL